MSSLEPYGKFIILKVVKYFGLICQKQNSKSHRSTGINILKNHKYCTKKFCLFALPFPKFVCTQNPFLGAFKNSIELSYITK